MARHTPARLAGIAVATGAAPEDTHVEEVEVFQRRAQ